MGENVRAMPSARSGELRSEPVPVSAVPAPATIAAHTPGPWIEWSGGECPVASDAIVHIKTRRREYCGLVAGEIGSDRWTHGPAYAPLGHIIAYRLASTDRELEA